MTAASLLQTLGETLRDLLPLVIVLVAFQRWVLRRSLPNPMQLLAGFGLVVVGLAFFLAGLEQAIFPVGRAMASQLTDPAFLGLDEGHAPGAGAYVWVYLFALGIGFSTTVAEPALIAVALKAEQLSAGAIDAWGLRIAVAVGVAIGIGLGVFRIVVGAPLHFFIMAGYAVVVVQTLFAPKRIVPLAFDSGGVTTSTVTVPLVAALGLGMAESLPGRSPLVDGFGLIAFASLFPMITVMAYAQAASFRAARRTHRVEASDDPVSSEENAS